MKKETELFKDQRWNEYQSVEVLKTKVKPTEEDKKKVEEFRKFIDEKIKKEEDTQKEN